MSPRRLYVLLYAALIVYGSLFPFVGWQPHRAGLLDFLVQVPDFRVHRADTLANVLAYVPLGLLLVRDLDRRSPLASLLLATLSGAALSFAMEFLQQFLPDRVATVQDIATNTAGCCAGAIIGVLTRVDVPAAASVARWRGRWLGHTGGEEFGLVAIGLWALSQWMPLVPSLDVGDLRDHLAPLWHALLDPDRFDPSRFAIYAFDVGGLAYLARTLGPDNRLVLAFAALALVVVPGKVVFAGRVLSLEALAGTLAGVAVAAPAVAASRRGAAFVAIALLLAGIAVSELRYDASRVFYPFTWIPFSAQLESPLTGIASLLETLWPAVGLSYLAHVLAASRHRAPVAWLGGVLLALYVFALEWNEQYLPGRVGDITPVLLIAGTWAFVWIAMPGASNARAAARSQAVSARPRGECR